MTKPDPIRALEKYRRSASTYDLWSGILPLQDILRRRAVKRLDLRQGDTVLDIGCGTGLSFAPLERAVGSAGRIVGIELSPDMLGRARRRVEKNGWDNVTLIESPAENAAIAETADAALLILVHDIMRSRDTLEGVILHLRPGARVVALGAKWARLLFPLNLIVWLIGRRYVTTFEGFSRPWSNLSSLIPNLRVRPVLLGTEYIAWGRVAD